MTKKGYPWRRHIWERFQLLATRGGWPAKAARRVFGVPQIRVQEHEVRVLPRGTPALRIGFAADFHAGPTTIPDVLHSACTLLTELAPHVLLLGGDFVCLEARHIDSFVDNLASIPTTHGRYAVLGNHDLWVDYRYIERRIEQAGIQLLTNSNVQLAAPFQDVWICGLDDHVSGQPDPRTAFDGAEGVRVLLMHAPSGLLDVGDAVFDVAFCGHTHGGQIALPNGTPVLLPEGRLSRTYPAGQYRLPSGSTLIVSRGVGCSTVPVRAFAPPDVIACTLAQI